MSELSDSQALKLRILRARKEVTAQIGMCKLAKLDVEGKGCKVLDGSLWTAKVTLAKGSPRMVYIQDLAHALNRRELLNNEETESFIKIGYEYMDV